MHTTITQTALDHIAPSLDAEAREAAHAVCDGTPAGFYSREQAEGAGIADGRECAAEGPVVGTPRDEAARWWASRVDGGGGFVASTAPATLTAEEAEEVHATAFVRAYRAG